MRTTRVVRPGRPVGSLPRLLLTLAAAATVWFVCASPAHSGGAALPIPTLPATGESHGGAQGTRAEPPGPPLDSLGETGPIASRPQRPLAPLATREVSPASTGGVAQPDPQRRPEHAGGGDHGPARRAPGYCTAAPEFFEFGPRAEQRHLRCNGGSDGGGRRA